jgi:hypothetical protein
MKLSGAKQQEFLVNMGSRFTLYSREKAGDVASIGAK